MKETLAWPSAQSVPSRDYRCGHCGSEIASERGWQGQRVRVGALDAAICICHRCTRPTFFDYDGVQIPGVVVGTPVDHVSDVGVAALYEEARRCSAAASPTAAILCCRKLLMHIAVDKGAKEGLGFVEYVKYLGDKHYVPPDATPWVDHIRTKGNEANHEITISTADEAEELIAFVEMLLKVIYEFPARAALRKNP